MKKYSKIITSIAALGLSVAVFGVGAFALFSASKEDTQTATTGSVSISLKEDFPTGYGEEGADTTEKTFWGVATGSKKSLARASVFVSVEYLNEETDEWEVFGHIPSNAVEYTISTDTTTVNDEGKYWVQGDDGYWYYKAVLEGNPNINNDGYQVPDSYSASDYTTTQFKIENVGINEDYADLASEYQVRINMLVTLETCQATNGAYQLSWGQVDENLLPSGVYVAEDLTAEQ